MSDGNDLQLALIDVGRFWNFYHAAVGKTPPEPGEVAQERFCGWVRTVALRFRRAILCDDSEVLSRRDIFPGYKPDGERNHPLPGKALLAGAVQSLEEFGLPVVRLRGFEADDLLAAYASAAVKRGWEVTIFSEDKDLLACIAPGVTVFRRDRGKGAPKNWNAEDVVAQFGVMPAQLQDFLALAGDSADGIPGVPGIAKESAAAILKEYGSATSAFEDVDPDGRYGARMSERIRKALTTGKADFELSLRLAKFNKDASAMIDSKLLDVPAGSPPTGPGGSPPATDVDTLVATPNRDGTVTQTIEKVSEQKTSTLLDDVTAATEAKAKVERWIGRHFNDSLEPRDPRGAHWLAGELDGAMVPGRRQGDPPQRLFKKVGNRQAIYAVIMKGREMGLPAMLALSQIHMVEGKAEISSQLMVALVLRSGLAKYIRCTASDNNGATWETWRVGAPAAVRLTFGKDDRQRAGLGGREDSVWEKYPRTMYEWRAVSQLLRREYADVVAGIYVTGELSGDGEIDVEEELRKGRELGVWQPPPKVAT